MSKLKKVLLMCTAWVLVAALAIGGTLAYLQAEDSDVNVMTLGNVSIRQNEEQRVDPSRNGTLTDADIEDFKQAKPLLPYVEENMNGAMRDEYEEITFPNGQTNKLFIGDNAIDKLVSVTNTGKTDAYVRSIIALEAPTDKIDLSFNSTGWAMDKTASSYSIEVDGVKYDLFVCVYKNILKPGETTPYSLLQILLDGTATNEDAAAYGDTYDVLVLSQAIQTAGFADAATALNAGFGVVTADSAAEWFDGTVIPSVAAGSEDLSKALNGSGIIVLSEDVGSSSFAAEVQANTDVTIVMQEHTIRSQYIENSGSLTLENGKLESGTPSDYGVIGRGGSETVLNEVALTSGGGGIGAADGAKVEFNGGSIHVDSASTSGRYCFYAVGAGTEITINGGNFSWSSTKNQKRAYIYADSGTTVIVNGGTFGKASTRSGYTAGILGSGTVIIKGGTFGFNPSAWVADGYEAVQNGSTWTVSAKN